MSEVSQAKQVGSTVLLLSGWRSSGYPGVKCDSKLRNWALHPRFPGATDALTSPTTCASTSSWCVFPADCIVAWIEPQTGQAMVWDAYNPGIPTLPFFPAPTQDNNPALMVQGASPLDNQENVIITGSNTANDIITINLQRKMQTGDIFDFQLAPDMQFNIVWAYSSDKVFINEFNAIQPTHTAAGGSRWML